MPARGSLQGFRLDLKKVSAVVELISAGITSRAEIAARLRMGQRKVKSLVEWGCMIDFLDDDSKPSTIYAKARELDAMNKDLELLELIYFSVCRNNEAIGIIVNDIAHDLWRRKREPVFGVKEVADTLVEKSLPHSKGKIESETGNWLNSLAMPEGIGNLGTFVRTREKGRVTYGLQSHEPAPLIAAYIVYANWPSNTAKVAISEIVSGRNSVGRIFFLNEFQVMSVLRELEDRRLVKIETAAGLDQIGVNPEVTSEGILQMIVQEAKSEA